MVVDQTMQLAPVLWGAVTLLLVLSGAILASMDPEVTEAYLGDPRLLIAGGVLAVSLLVVLVVTRPEIAYGLSALWPN
jgi:hypothetical protein